MLESVFCLGSCSPTSGLYAKGPQPQVINGESGVTWGWEGLLWAGESFGEGRSLVACKDEAARGSLLVLGPVSFNLSSSLMRLARCWKLRPPLEAGDREGSSLHGAPSFQPLKGPSP